MEAAPTTEDVSWIESATHLPNCCCDKSNTVPTKGNITTAKAFNKKIIAIEDASSSGLAFMIGAKAAIAVPPHIAVPEIRRSKCFLSIFINDPSKKPRIITVITYREIKGK